MVVEKEIIDAYNSGESMNSIAKKFHLYPTSVRRILQKNNVELRHDSKKDKQLYVKNGEKLIEWAKAQGRLVTREELAAVIGTKRLSPSYFVKYPEIGKYVKIRSQKDLVDYKRILYDWLKENKIPYKPSDRTKIGYSIDALLLEDYSNIALQVTVKPAHKGERIHNKEIKNKTQACKDKGVILLSLEKEQLENLDELKDLLDSLKALRR